MQELQHFLDHLELNPIQLFSNKEIICTVELLKSYMFCFRGQIKNHADDYHDLNWHRHSVWRRCDNNRSVCKARGFTKTKN